MRTVADFMFRPSVGLGMSWAIHVIYYVWGRQAGHRKGFREGWEHSDKMWRAHWDRYVADRQWKIRRRAELKGLPDPYGTPPPPGQ